MKTSEKAIMHNEHWLTSTRFSPFSAPWMIKFLRGYVFKSSAALNPLTITQLACELSMRGRSIADGVAWPIPSISGAHAHYAYNGTRMRIYIRVARTHVSHAYS